MCVCETVYVCVYECLYMCVHGCDCVRETVYVCMYVYVRHKYIKTVKEEDLLYKRTTMFILEIRNYQRPSGSNGLLLLELAC